MSHLLTKILAQKLYFNGKNHGFPGMLVFGSSPLATHSVFYQIVPSNGSKNLLKTVDINFICRILNNTILVVTETNFYL